MENETVVPTIEGWKKIKDVKIGDKLFDEQGEVCSVTYVSEEFIPEKMYRVEFCDGAKLEVPKDFLLTVWDNSLKLAFRSLNLRRSLDNFLPYDWAKFEINSINDKYLSLAERHTIKRLREDGMQIRPLSREVGRSRSTVRKYFAESIEEHDVNTYSVEQLINKIEVKKDTFYIPYTKPVKFVEKQLPIEPWIFGYQLGDANTLTGTCIACHPDDKQELIKLFTDAGIVVSEYPNRPGHFGLLNMTPIWKGLGLSKGKFIPEDYFLGSPKQRARCAAGLIDSDGSLHIQHGYNFGNTNKDLVFGMVKILKSLGIKHSIFYKDGSESDRYEKKTKPQWKIYFKSDRISCELERKKNTLASTTWRHLTREIKNMYNIDSKPFIDIKVDSKSGLYLITEDYIPVRNII